MGVSSCCEMPEGDQPASKQPHCSEFPTPRHTLQRLAQSTRNLLNLRCFSLLQRVSFGALTIRNIASARFSMP